MNRTLLLAGLVSLNLILLTGIVLVATPPPRSALAQATGLAGNYMVVAGEIQDQHDALYLVDTRARKLYAFTYNRGRRQLDLAAGRDLERDFRHNRD